MFINFQQNRVSRSIKTVHTALFPKNCKLHKFVICNWNFKESRLSNMHYHITNIQANLGSIGLLDIKLPQKEITDTDGRTDVAYDNNRRLFQKKNRKKNY